MKKQYITTFAGIFVLVSTLLYIVQAQLPAYNFTVLEVGNGIMLALSIISFYIVVMQLGKSPGAFIRGIMGATFFKLMFCLVAMLVYVVLNRSSIHKPSIFVLFGIYAIYTTFETLLLTKLGRTVK